MPNAILRAGPFASSSSSFLNQPEPLLPHGYSPDRAVPTNCASEFPFRSYIKKSTYAGGWSWTNVPEIQLKESGSELINVSNENQITTHDIFAMFRYQAARDFNVKLHYAISAFSAYATVTCFVEKKIGTNDPEDIVKLTSYPLRSSNSIDIDDEIVIPLAASVVPRFVGFRIGLWVDPYASSLTSDASLILKPD
jgi:hypothetical protein